MITSNQYFNVYALRRVGTAGYPTDMLFNVTMM